MSGATWEFLSGTLMMPDDQRLDSPIERAFYRCFRYVALGLGDDYQLLIATQVHIGAYRVDFLITDKAGKRLLVVECDGHDFHDRTKEQASRDKGRDRTLLLDHGLPTMRFTGSDIYANPFECAAQALAHAIQAAAK